MDRDRLNRISIPYFQNYSVMTSRTRTPEGTAFMFARDLPLGMMPYRSRRTRTDYAVKLEPADSEVEGWLNDLLGSRSGRGYNLEDTIDHFMDRILTYLGHNGELYMELLTDPEDDNKIKGIDILPLGRIVKLGRKYYQIVPKVDWEKGKPRYAAIPERKIWHLALPEELGSPKEHRRMLDELGRLSSPMPKFAQDDPSLGTSKGYEFMRHRKDADTAIEFLTQRWGSIPSLRQIKGTTEYYYIENSLRWAYAQALIREHVIDEINMLLKKNQAPNRLVIEGLPSSGSILETIDKLGNGEIGFEVALQNIKID